MSFCTLFYLLLILAVFFGVYFAYNTAKEDGKEFDPMEFIKILGLFLLCAIVFGVFVDVFFLASRFFVWIVVKVLNFLRMEIFSRRTGSILSLLAINAMGGYLFWEMLKEKKEKDECACESSTSETKQSIKTKDKAEEAAAEFSEPSTDIQESDEEEQGDSEVDEDVGTQGEENHQENGEAEEEGKDQGNS